MPSRALDNLRLRGFHEVFEEVRQDSDAFSARQARHAPQSFSSKELFETAFFLEIDFAGLRQDQFQKASSLFAIQLFQKIAQTVVFYFERELFLGKIFEGHVLSKIDEDSAEEEEDWVAFVQVHARSLSSKFVQGNFVKI